MMRRRPILVVLLVLGAAFPAAARADRQDVQLTARTKSCATGPTADDRNAVFTGSMPTDTGAVRLAMRFDLREHPPGGEWRSVKVAGFGVWLRSAPNVAGYVVDKRVEQLRAGSSYRVVVQFRWYDAGGDVIKSARRTSLSCRQTDVRPDLRVTSIDVFAAPDGLSATYRVGIRNDGPGDVPDPFGVALAVGTTVLRPADPIEELDAGVETTVVMQGPVCAAGTLLRAVVDPDGEVEEPDEHDNVLTRPC